MADDINLYVTVSADRVATHMAENPDFLAEVLEQLRSENRLVRDDRRDNYLGEFGQTGEIPSEDKTEIANFLRELADALEEDG